jgi:formate dehydrogenase accessory protein FdhE
MTFAQTGGPNYDARIRRAQFLATAHAFAAEILAFYQHLAAFHKRLYAQFPQPGDSRSANSADASCPALRSPLDLALLLQHLPDLLSLLQRVGPQPVAAVARELALQGPAAWITLLTEYWSTAGLALEKPPEPRSASETLVRFVLRAFLEPYAEFLASRSSTPPAVGTPNVCPLCGSLPLLGVLRPEGDGGRRALICSLCLCEWNFRRIFCPACGEEAESKLPVYVVEQLPHLRVEACDTCHFYVRTIDLTKDGNAVPLVDDLAAIPLSLWASEHGYSRIHPNLLAT